MTVLWAAVGAVVWVLLAIPLAVVVGRAIAAGGHDGAR